MTWVLIGVAAWVALALAGALLIGRAIHLADRRSGRPPNFVVDDTALPQPRTPPPAERPGPTRSESGDPDPARSPDPPPTVQGYVATGERPPLPVDSPLPRPPC